jgi:hypothetical protein
VRNCSNCWIDVSKHLPKSMNKILKYFAPQVTLYITPHSTPTIQINRKSKSTSASTRDLPLWEVASALKTSLPAVSTMQPANKTPRRRPVAPMPPPDGDGRLGYMRNSREVDAIGVEKPMAHQFSDAWWNCHESLLGFRSSGSSSTTPSPRISLAAERPRRGWQQSRRAGGWVWDGQRGR